MHIKDGRILLDCKACGQRSEVDLRLKLSSFILKNQPKKGKKDKSSRKAERKSRKGDEADGEEGSRNGSNGSDEDHPEENGDIEIEAGSDDELTRQIEAGAKELDDAVDATEVEWTVDTSAAAVKARAQTLPEDLKRALVIEADDEDDGGNVYNELGTWIIKQAEEKGGIDKVDSVEIYLKAKELGIESKHRTLTVLAQALFDENIVKQIPSRAAMLKKVSSRANIQNGPCVRLLTLSLR